MDTKYRRPSSSLNKSFLDGAQSAFQRNLSWQKAVRRSYEVSTTPLNRWSHTQASFQYAQNVLGVVLKQMDKAEGDSLQAVVDHYGLSKPDVTTALENLEALTNMVADKTRQKDDSYSLMAAGYAALDRQLDEKRRKAARKRTPLSRPTPPAATL